MQWFKNNPANGEFRRAEMLKFLCYAVFKKFIRRVRFQLNSFIIACKNITCFVIFQLPFLKID